MRLDRIKLKTLLLQSDLKQKDLAERAGLTRNTVCAVCGGKSCSPATAGAIAKALGVKLTAIQEGR